MESLYQNYRNNPESVDIQWQKFFEGFEFATDSVNGTTPSSNGTATVPTPSTTEILTELKVYSLISAYRKKAHLLADTNPIKKRKDRKPHLDLADFGLTKEDLTASFIVGQEIGLGKQATLQEIIDKLKTIYCGTIGFEYDYITDPEQVEWLRNKIENRPSAKFSLEEKKHIFRKLTKAVLFEKFLHTKYIGQKRFSLEGGDAAIPALDAIINVAAKNGVQEVVIGMAHRGRLNVLANIMQKTYEHIFNEFEGHAPVHHEMGDGDVKYHLGYSSLLSTKEDKKVHVKLVPNPSHLEAVDPVVQGFARAKADVVYSSDYDAILPILIHGDAAVAGQGIVYELIQMGKLEGYYVGGTIHFVINNQIGFTTDFDDARSSDYSTSIASIVKAPVLHVNGDDVEAVVWASQLAAEYRQKFNSDIFIDMVCYRRHGHNEGDDPSYTQPGMYKIIKKHPNLRKIYGDKLIKDSDGKLKNLVDQLNNEFWDNLQDRLNMVQETPLEYVYQEPELAWKKLRKSTREDFDQSPITGIPKDTVKQIVDALVTVPKDFTPLRKINKMLEKRREAMNDNRSIDWAAAELLAYGSILMDGNNVRLSGEDVKRGTFSHRHVVLNDEKNYKAYNRLAHIAEEQGDFLIYNSLLSEYAVLGFEFGYTMASPDTLTIWEAQFGDFANGAQIIIDQFIASSESKWGRNSGLVMLLPHGYAGQGPEHSSARLERFLQLCGEQNMIIANITDPANFFHALRRQQIQPFRKPLIVMSPKSLLRHSKCQSSIFDIIGDDKNFQEVLDDTFIKDPKQVKRVLLCSGKLYYELAAKQEQDDRQDIAIIRLEQLYPIPRLQFSKVLEKYGDVELVWVQEEPANMGALWHILYRFRENPPKFIARKNSASPATGYKKQHEKEQAIIIEKAFAEKV